MRRAGRPAALLASLALLAGCSSLGNITGLIVGGATGGATANPAIGYAVGIAVAAGTDAGYKYMARRWHRSEQDAIAAVAGVTPEGVEAPWRIRHDLPLGNEHGTLRVVRLIDTKLATCREVIFSVEDEPDPAALYVADICRQGNEWKWATAEPAVERWGYLQAQ